MEKNHQVEGSNSRIYSSCEGVFEGAGGGDLLIICSARVEAFSRGEGNSRIYGTRLFKRSVYL